MPSKIMPINDPITLEIIQNSLQATADEMFAAMRKTAMSSIIYEVLDMGTGITDGQGRIAASGAGIPGFIGVLDKAVKVLIEKFNKPGAIQPGDVFITNDPYYGGVTHLNDLVIAMPVFSGNRLIAWTANIAHNSDIGGMAPGSLTGDATEIFQEGLRLPAIKMISKGEPIQSVLDILFVNSRMPDYLKGDVWAAISSVRIGAKRLVDMAEKYGTETFCQAVESFMAFGETSTLAKMKNLPHGTFELTEDQDDGRQYNVKITINETQFLVDLSDNPDQDTGPNNTSRDGTMVCVQMIFKSLIDHSSPANDGSFRPIRLLTREGSIFHAKEPAAVGFYYETKARVYDLIWHCLAPHVSGRLASGHFSSICGTFISGTHPDTGRQYTVIEPQLGGWGASHNRDGNNCIFSGGHGETYNTPAEISEARNGLIVDRMELNTQAGGEGEFSGGHGLTLEYRIRANKSFLTAAYTRSKVPPWALNGGNEGSTNYLEVIRQGEKTERFSTVSGLALNKNDVIRIVTANGAGHGDPNKRDAAAIREDLKNELISAERAKDVYGISE